MAQRQFLQVTIKASIPKVDDGADDEAAATVLDAVKSFKVRVGTAFKDAEFDVALKTIKRKDA
mgnify:CR=1 FL=1